MLITDVYTKYRINKGLQEHMIRVAAVALMVCEKTPFEVDTATVVTACLLHDMGNLIKTKFETAPVLFEPEGVAYWKQVQQEVIARYGTDVHTATLQMITDLQPDQKVIDVVTEATFEDIEAVMSSGSHEAKLLEYADMRVGLYGVVSVEQRFQDICDRYVPHHLSLEQVHSMKWATLAAEHEIFADSLFVSEEIDDESTSSIQNTLRHWDVVSR